MTKVAEADFKEEQALKKDNTTGEENGLMVRENQNLRQQLEICRQGMSSLEIQKYKNCEEHCLRYFSFSSHMGGILQYV